MEVSTFLGWKGFFIQILQRGDGRVKAVLDSDKFERIIQEASVIWFALSLPGNVPESNMASGF